MQPFLAMRSLFGKSWCRKEKGGLHAPPCMLGGRFGCIMRFRPPEGYEDAGGSIGCSTESLDGRGLFFSCNEITLRHFSFIAMR
jgi:hypothetical protein